MAHLQEWERSYVLTKALRLVHATLAITKCQAAARAKTPEEAKQKRVEVAPICLKGRVQRDEALPEVEVREVEQGAGQTSGGEGEGEDEGAPSEEDKLRAVVGYVISGLDGALWVELMQWMGR